MNGHEHNWRIYNSKYVQCVRCDTLMLFEDLLENERKDAAQQERIGILSKQLYGHELKKPAHSKYYAEMMRLVPISTLEKKIDDQAALL